MLKINFSHSFIFTELISLIREAPVGAVTRSIRAEISDGVHFTRMNFIAPEVWETTSFHFAETLRGRGLGILNL